MTINRYFDKIFVINLASRPDRLEHFKGECRKHGLSGVERFEGFLKPICDGKANGNLGCTASHRAILDLICHYKWPRTLVFEDDMNVVVPNLQEQFSKMIEEVPETWQMLYLGGSYAEAPKGWHSRHVVRINGIQTTSSYAVTHAAARAMAPHISGAGPIDNLYHRWSTELESYMFEPRLCAQYTNVSDLQDREMNNEMSMLDKGHIQRLCQTNPRP